MLNRYLCTRHKNFFRVYLLSSFYIWAGSLGRGPAFFLILSRLIAIQQDPLRYKSGLLSYKPYSRICNPAAYKTCCLQCRQIANLPERNNLPERLTGTEDSRGQTLRPAELCRGHSRAGSEHGGIIAKNGW